MTKAEERRIAWEEARRREKEAELSFTKKLVDAVRAWRHCENRACRRGRGCADARACNEKHADAILEWQRRVYVPYLRERYPTVQWGAPAGVVEPQYQAALEAERQEEARRQGRPLPDSEASSDKRAERQPAYDPGDW